jgi:hypothetical protein
VQQDVEILFAFIMGSGSVACSALEDVGKASGDVVEFLLLQVVFC